MLESAVRAPQPWHEGAVRAAWASDDEAWRVSAIFCMGMLDEFDFAREVGEAWRSASALLRRQAMIAAADRGMRELLPEAVRVAVNPEAELELRVAALQLLGAIGSSDELAQVSELEGHALLGEDAREAVHWIELRSDADFDDLGGFGS